MINWRINPAWVKAGEGPHCDIPNTDWIDAIYFALYTNSAFLKLMNTDLKEFQNEPIQIKGIRACVDGKYYTVEDLCKEFSALKELHRSHTEAFEKGAANQNAMIQTLHKEVDNLRGMNDTLR